VGQPADHAYCGLAGMLLIDDPQTHGLALRSRYGVDDSPLFVQDKRLDDDGRLDFGKGMISPIGRLGDRSSSTARARRTSTSATGGCGCGS
jgi:FtsP/CotA-like multicopper oxidase with cupredoxin domain